MRNTSLKAPSTALLKVPRTTSPTPWTAAAAALMGFVVCLEVGTVFGPVPAPVVVVVLVFMVVISVCKGFEISGFLQDLRNV